MRIIAGSARGRRLHAPQRNCSAIRPTADRAREALFSIIGSRIVGSRVVDLFAGTGALGCEALSRGADRVVFIDNSQESIEMVEKNVTLVADGPFRSRLLKIDLSRGLEKIKPFLQGKPCFDIVFADPPYLAGLAEHILFELDKSTMLSQNPLVIIEEQKTFSPPEKLTTLYLSDRRTYGKSSFFFYTFSKTSL